MYWGTKGDQNNPLPWNFLVRSRFSFSNDLILRSRTSTDRWSILSLSNSKHSCKLSASDSLLQTKLYSQHLTVCCKQHCTLSIWQFAANNTVLSASDSLLQTKLYSQHLCPTVIASVYTTWHQNIILTCTIMNNKAFWFDISSKLQHRF